jgi:Mg/Co/Ni transporter MgtE
VPTVRLRAPHPKLARLHPAELADLVEAASHREGEEIIQGISADPELEADVFEELESGHQLEFIADRPDTEIAAVLARMESDDAADLIAELPEARREEIVALLPEVQRRRLRTLLGHDPATAGGLMSPDFICLYSQATREEALDRVARSGYPSDAIAWLFVMNQARRLSGAIHLVDVLRAEPGGVVRDLAAPAKRVRTDADIEEVARLMTDYDLTVVAVVDDEERLQGVITVDDVLELVLPPGWRRHFGVLGD